MATAITPDSRRVVFSRFNVGGFHVFDTISGQAEKHSAMIGARYSSIVVSNDGTKAVSAGVDGIVRLWDMGTVTELKSGSDPAGSIRCVAFSSDGSRFLTGAEVGTVRLWNSGTLEEEACFTGHMQPVNCVVFSPSGNLAASGSDDATIRLWPLPSANGKKMASVPK
jgi:WD40 repeat protein